MKIAIIGAGNVGRAIAASSLRAGHEVVISSSDEVTARSAATATGATAALSNAAAIHDADIVILAVPLGAVDAIATEIGAGLDG